MQGHATFSEDRVYRYKLSRRWRGGQGRVVWVMLNPSTADATHDDPTIRRCLGFSRAWGFSRMDVVNLFALRATDPRLLQRHKDPVGPDNDDAIAKSIAGASVVVAAWGAFAMAAHRGRSLADAAPLVCLGVTAHGAPRHPLYVRADVAPVPYSPPQVQPAANLLRKQPKSRTFRIGGCVLASQLA